MTSIVTKAPFEQQYLALRELDGVRLSPRLARAVHASHRMLVDCSQELRLMGEGRWSYCPTGQIASIGLDPMLPSLSGDARLERLQDILQATKGPSMLRVAAPVLRSTALVGEVTEGQLRAAEAAAEAAMRAWDVANDHARAIGIDDRSLVERRALRRLHSLVNQLADPGTPRAMRGELIDGIAVQLPQLSTVPIAWTQIVQLPEIQAGEHIQAIEQRIGLSPAAI